MVGVNAEVCESTATGVFRDSAGTLFELSCIFRTWVVLRRLKRKAGAASSSFVAMVGSANMVSRREETRAALMRGRRSSWGGPISNHSIQRTQYDNIQKVSTRVS